MAVLLAAGLVAGCSSSDDEEAVGCDVDVLHAVLEEHEGDIDDFGLDDVDCDGDYAFARVEQPPNSQEYGFVAYFERSGSTWEVLVAGNDPGEASDHGVPDEVWDGLGDE
jgi:hypothetical protein